MALFLPRGSGETVKALDTARLPRLGVGVWVYLSVPVFVDSLRSQTVNALRPSSDATVRDEYSEDDITLDPLIVLRCDSRVFRSVTSSSRVCQDL